MPERDICYSIIYLGDNGHVGFQDLRRNITLEEAVSVGGATDELWGVKSDGNRFSYPIQRFKPTSFAVVEGFYPSGLINLVAKDGIIRCDPELVIDQNEIDRLIKGGTVVIDNESEIARRKLLK